MNTRHEDSQLAQSIPDPRQELILTAARRFRDLQALPQLAGLAPSRLLNRLHAEGLKVNQTDVDEGLALLSEDESAGDPVSHKDAAKIIGCTPEQLLAFAADPPATAPPLRVLSQSPMGRISYFGATQIAAFARWYAEGNE